MAEELGGKTEEEAEEAEDICVSTNYSTNSKSVNLNLVQSLAIKLPHTLRCNLQFTIPKRLRKTVM